MTIVILPANDVGPLQGHHWRLLALVPGIKNGYRR
jgi:hypothetical protein